MPIKVLGYKNLVDVLSSYCPQLKLKTNLVPRIFSCITCVHNQNPTRKKIDHESLKCVFIGYSNTKKGYKC